MSRLTSKSKKRQKRIAVKQRKIRKMERQDSLGISRKKRKKYIYPNIYIILKIISIASYPVVYLIYSPLLILCVIFSISLFYFSTLVENYHNHTFIKKNHIKITKFDSITAVFLFIITILGSFSNLTSKIKMSFGRSNKFNSFLESIGSCLTGKRGLFNSFGMKFTMKEPPANMEMPFPGEGMMKPPMKFDMKDLPVEMIFSSTLSSICTVFIIIIPIFSIISLLMYMKKRKKHDIIMNDIIDDQFVELTNEQYEKLFTFMEIVE